MVESLTNFLPEENFFLGLFIAGQPLAWTPLTNPLKGAKEKSTRKTNSLTQERESAVKG